MNLKRKIVQKEEQKSGDKLFLNNLACKQRSIDLYSNLKESHQNSRNPEERASALEGNFYRRIFRYSTILFSHLIYHFFLEKSIKGKFKFKLGILKKCSFN